MRKCYRVKVKSDHRWAVAHVAGQVFTKTAAVDVWDDALEAVHLEEILASPVLEVEEMKEMKPKARTRARQSSKEKIDGADG